MLTRHTVTLEVDVEADSEILETIIDDNLRKWFERLSVTENAASDGDGGWIRFKKIKARCNYGKKTLLPEQIQRTKRLIKQGYKTKT